MTEEEKREARKVLKRHLLQIKATFENPEYDEIDSYAFLAGHLRVLLCDGEMPVLTTYADGVGIPLEIVRPLLAIEKDAGMLLGVNLFAGAWGLPGGLQLVSIREYLDTPIGVLPYSDGKTAPEGMTFTPRQVIKWVANKDGVAHLDPKKPRTYRMLKEVYGLLDGKVKDEYLIRSTIYQIAYWTFHAIQFLLSVEGLKDLLNERLIALGVDELPEYQDIKTILADYDLKPILGGYLIGNYCYGGAVTPARRYDNAFSWHALLNILHQLGREEKVLYEAALNDGITLRIFLDASLDLHCRVGGSDAPTVEVSFKNFANSRFFSRYFYLSCQLRRSPGGLELTMHADGELVDSAEGKIDMECLELKEHVIGGSIERRKNCAAIISSFTAYDAWFDRDAHRQLEIKLWMWLLEMMAQPKDGGSGKS